MSNSPNALDNRTSHRAMTLAVWVGCGLALVAVIGSQTDEERKQRRPDNPTLRPVAWLQAGQENEDDAASDPKVEVDDNRRGILIRVPLPISGEVDTHVKSMVSELRKNLPDAAADNTVLVFSFETQEQGQSGDNSDFARSWSLARFLAGDEISRMRTVAYLPQTVRGHAVLPVIACDEIIMHRDARLGDASASGEFVDNAMRGAYEELAKRRRTIPAAVALAMLDPDIKLIQADTLDGIRYIPETELGALENRTTVSEISTVTPAGETAIFSADDMRLKYHWATNYADNIRELAAALGMNPQNLEQNPALGGAWKPIQIDVVGLTATNNIDWIIKQLASRLDDGDVNLVFVNIDSPGGSAAESQRLAKFLAEQEPGKVRTVAYIRGQARDISSVIALACDEIVMHPDAQLGGPGDRLGEMKQEDVVLEIQAIAADKDRDWSLWASLVYPRIQVFRYTHKQTGSLRYLSEAEAADLEQPELWEKGAPIDTEKGLTGAQAEQMGVANLLTSSFSDLQDNFRLNGTSVEVLEPNWAHAFVEWLASPAIAGTLLFIAWFAMFIEFAQPGIGLPGFVSAVCFLLYFWSNFLHGTAGWLEVALFAGGIACMVVEVFVTPGFGIFGVGGIGMIIVSIVLASQTFVIPSNTEELHQVPRSLAMVIAAGAGVGTSIAVIRKFLPHTPYFNKMLLNPPEGEELDDLRRRETLARYDHLLGETGIASTRLSPAGKVRIGDDLIDVVADGELLDAGTPVVVTEVRGTYVKVQSVED